MHNKIMATRNTNQRKLILEIMDGNFSHPTADEIYEKARLLDPHISRGTVYRNLALLSQAGLLLKISIPNGADHYDSTLKNHYHFCCKSCNKMFDTPENSISKIKNIAASISSKMNEDGFLVEGHNLVFTGLCPECNKLKNKKS